ncbi:MAG: hypothetical protein WDZ41_05750 [Candidatus Babeliales bacterium]
MINVGFFITFLIINAIVWYFFFYCLLYSIKNTVNLYLYSFYLLILFSLGFATCPFILACGKGMMMNNKMDMPM